MKQTLASLRWNSFDRYPPQGEEVYIYFKNDSRNLHKFFKVAWFNAVSFDIRGLISRLPDVERWEIKWLPANKIAKQ